MSVDDSSASSSSSTAEVPAEASSASALQDNIRRRGKHAYYYAHSHKATGPEWDGKIEPRLLSTSSTASSPGDLSGSLTASSNNNGDGIAFLARSNIKNYAFLNEATKVKVYVDLPGVGECPDDNIALEHTERSLSLTVKNYVQPPKGEGEGGATVADTSPEEEAEGAEGAMEEEGTKAGEERRLVFGKLSGAIESAAFRKKAHKLILTLKKKEEGAWTSVGTVHA